MLRAIEVDHLRKSFGDFPAVHDASFSADSGEMLSLLGSNGAGKSTTISMLSGLLTPTGGDACIAIGILVGFGVFAMFIIMPGMKEYDEGIVG